jgi:hypothetical protein
MDAPAGACERELNRWLTPTSITPARFAKITAQVDF